MPQFPSLSPLYFSRRFPNAGASSALILSPATKMASLAFLGLERAWRRRRACPKQRWRRWNASAGAPSVLEVTSTQVGARLRIKLTVGIVRSLVARKGGGRRRRLISKGRPYSRPVLREVYVESLAFYSVSFPWISETRLCFPSAK